jgi:hypothetical protein
VGKIVIAFLFFLAASTLAIREARPLPAPEPARVEPPLSHEPRSRAVHDAVPPWVRLAPPPPLPPAIAVPPVAVPPVTVPTVIVIDEERDSGADVLDEVDRCPDQPEDNADDDGCPEPVNGPAQPRMVVQLEVYR